MRLTLYQIAIACGDLLVAAAILYTLLPPVEGGYVRVLGVFMLAIVAAVVSHVPGGYGVFDVLIVEFLPKEHGPAVVAALLVFRVIYDWLPLLIAAAMLGRNEWRLNREPKNARSRNMGWASGCHDYWPRNRHDKRPGQMMSVGEK